MECGGVLRFAVSDPPLSVTLLLLLPVLFIQHERISQIIRCTKAKASRSEFLILLFVA